jgi:hypothetical protein
MMIMMTLGTQILRSLKLIYTLIQIILFIFLDFIQNEVILLCHYFRNFIFHKLNETVFSSNEHSYYFH